MCLAFGLEVAGVQVRGQRQMCKFALPLQRCAEMPLSCDCVQEWTHACNHMFVHALKKHNHHTIAHAVDERDQDGIFESGALLLDASKP